MADYPLNYDVGSTFEPDAGIDVDHADDGTVRTRGNFSATQYKITLKHGVLTAAEEASLKSHYAAHIGVAFNLVTPASVTYSVRYINEPKADEIAGGNFRGTTQLIGAVV